MVLYQTSTLLHEYPENERISIKDLAQNNVNNISQMSCQKIKTFIPKSSLDEACNQMLSGGAEINLDCRKHEMCDFLWILSRVGHTMAGLNIFLKMYYALDGHHSIRPLVLQSITLQM